LCRKSGLFCEQERFVRILYGAFAQGQGHFSKAAVLVPLLESRGHLVRVISSGGDEPPAGYRFRWHRHFSGISYVLRGGRTHYGRSFQKWVRQLPEVFGHLRELRSIVREFAPDIVLSDFEPLTASPLIEPRCEVVALSRQMALLDPQIPLPPEMYWEGKITRTVSRIFSAGADRRYGYHYAPTTDRCIPLVIRPELANIRVCGGDFLVVYNVYQTSDDGSAQSLIEWAKKRLIRVRAYGFPEMERGLYGLVEFKPPGRESILNDIACSRGVFTTAGLTTPIEGFLLGKPVCVVPIPGLWEQYVNAFHLQELGLATWCKSWDYDRLSESQSVRANHPLLKWLTIPVERVVAHVLDGSRLTVPSVEPQIGASRPQLPWPEVARGRAAA
jgi:uncharacterized protein (TIGR00661 family)